MCWLNSATPHRVGFWRTVSADDPDCLFGADLAVDLPEEVDEMGIYRDRFRFAPVAHQTVDFPERLFVVPAVHLVGDGQLLVGVNVVKGDRPRFALGDRVLQVLASEKDEKRGDAAAVARPGATQGQCIPVRDFDRHVPTLDGAIRPSAASAAGEKLHRSPQLLAATKTLDALLIREGLTRGQRTRPPRCRRA